MRRAPISPAIATTVLLIGNPNAGKSTLFNHLTGAHQRASNAPGTTVELAHGLWRSKTDPHVRMLDLPGTYSLLARTPDEHVVTDAVNRAGDGSIAIVVIDATALTRSLYLLGQVAQRGVPLVAVVTKADRMGPEVQPWDPTALATALGIPVVTLGAYGRTGGDDLRRAIAKVVAAKPTVHGIVLRAPAVDAATPTMAYELAHASALFDWVERTTTHILNTPVPRATITDRIDRWLLKPVVGLPVFAAVLWLLFELATRLAAPLMDGVTTAIDGTAAPALATWLEMLGSPDGLISAVTDGLLMALGTVVAFIPLMFLMHTAITALDSSGYLARAAVVTNRAMRVIGLDGRAVVPLIVGFGCNLPALAATGALPHARHRLVVRVLIPYTSCVARLTVYLMLAAVFFPANAGLVVLAMYVSSVVLIVVASTVMQRGGGPGQRTLPLVMVLPTYQWPTWRTVLPTVLTRIRGFVLKAGKVIVVVLMVVWLAMSVDVRGDQGFGQAPVEDSAYGVAAHAIAPAFAPMGLDDWRVASAIMTGFVAKEVMVGALAQSHALDDEQGDSVTFSARLHQTVTASSDGHPRAAAAAFLIFVLAYTPCVATLAEQRRLLGRRWAYGAAVSQLAAAWVLASLVFMIGRLL
jgi:ferrous iron transport protein B